MGHVRSARRRTFRAVLAGVALALMPVATATAAAAESGLRADLDGAPLKLAEVGNWYCHDFDYPVIHCFSDPAILESAVAPILGRSATGFGVGSSAATASQASSTSGVNYVLVFDFTSYAGAYMYMSQDYTVLATIGWNDRISSYWALNSQSGKFWTDWFYSGSYYSFCCNQQVPSLGGYDNSFSSVFRY
jgi:hypothetical protein